MTSLSFSLNGSYWSQINSGILPSYSGSSSLFSSFHGLCWPTMNFMNSLINSIQIYCTVFTALSNTELNCPQTTDWILSSCLSCMFSWGFDISCLLFTLSHLSLIYFFSDFAPQLDFTLKHGCLLLQTNNIYVLWGLKVCIKCGSVSFPDYIDLEGFIEMIPCQS